MINDNDKTNNNRLPNKAFDKEYMTEWRREMTYLEEHGIHYTYVKRTPDYHIKMWKYEKTSKLFEVLKEFYKMIESESKESANNDI